MQKAVPPKITYVTLFADESIHPKYEAALKRFDKELGRRYPMYIEEEEVWSRGGEFEHRVGGDAVGIGRPCRHPAATGQRAGLRPARRFDNYHGRDTHRRGRHHQHAQGGESQRVALSGLQHANSSIINNSGFWLLSPSRRVYYEKIQHE
jgi:hypothetical protein